jgi:tetrahydromethanopterin S-methyltransferase subunit G
VKGDIRCLKYELKRLKGRHGSSADKVPVIQERGVEVVLPSDVEDLTQKVDDITRKTDEANDELRSEISSLRTELAEIRKSAEEARAAAESAKETSVSTGATGIPSSVSSPSVIDSDVKHDLRCIKYELRKLKGGKVSGSDEIPVIQERGVEVVLASDVEDLTQKVDDITRKTDEANDELRSEISSLRT